MNLELVLFVIVSIISVLAALGVVLNNNPVRSALSLVGVLFSIAVMFLMLHASFIAAVQIIVYAGAIMVLFVFVIMMLNLDTPEPTKNLLKPQNWLAPLASLILVAVIGSGLTQLPTHTTLLPAAMTGAFEVGVSLFSQDWIFPFEAVSILLLVAAVGAVVLAKKKLS